MAREGDRERPLLGVQIVDDEPSVDVTLCLFVDACLPWGGRVRQADLCMVQRLSRGVDDPASEAGRGDQFDGLLEPAGRLHTGQAHRAHGVAGRRDDQLVA